MCYWPCSKKLRQGNRTIRSKFKEVQKPSSTQRFIKILSCFLPLGSINVWFFKHRRWVDVGGRSGRASTNFVGFPSSGNSNKPRVGNFQRIAVSCPFILVRLPCFTRIFSLAFLSSFSCLPLIIFLVHVGRTPSKQKLNQCWNYFFTKLLKNYGNSITIIFPQAERWIPRVRFPLRFWHRQVVRQEGRRKIKHFSKKCARYHFFSSKFLLTNFFAGCFWALFTTHLPLLRPNLRNHTLTLNYSRLGNFLAKKIAANWRTPKQAFGFVSYKILAKGG